MIPLVRRALDPGVASAFAAANYTDDMIKDVTADAVSNISLCVGSDFPYTLSVTQRNAITNYPEEFDVSPEMPYEVQVLVSIQAAINACVGTLNELKTKESIKDEGSDWSYEKSSAVIRDKLRALMADRDNAIKNLKQVAGGNLEVFVNTLDARAPELNRQIEPWFYE